MTHFLHLLFFSSRRRYARFDCDWSSDVCSSDLYCSSKMTSLSLWPNPAQTLVLPKRAKSSGIFPPSLQDSFPIGRGKNLWMALKMECQSLAERPKSMKPCSIPSPDLDARS